MRWSVRVVVHKHRNRETRAPDRNKTGREDLQVCRQCAAIRRRAPACTRSSARLQASETRSGAPGRRHSAGTARPQAFVRAQSNKGRGGVHTLLTGRAPEPRLPQRRCLPRWRLRCPLLEASKRCRGVFQKGFKNGCIRNLIHRPQSTTVVHEHAGRTSRGGKPSLPAKLATRLWGQRVCQPCHEPAARDTCAVPGDE